MSNASAHAVTLNALDEMQQSFAYAARRSVLASAEQIIAQQESQLSECRAAEQVALAETQVYRTMVDSLRGKVTNARAYAQSQCDTSSEEVLLWAQLLNILK